jgi:hypothetical protein
MIRFIIFISVLLAIPVRSFSVTVEKKSEFFAGVLLLQSTTGIADTEKAKKYLQLRRLTGITTAQASALLRSVRERPEEWQAVQIAMSKLIDEQKAAVSKSDVRKQEFVGPLKKPAVKPPDRLHAIKSPIKENVNGRSAGSAQRVYR